MSRFAGMLRDRGAAVATPLRWLCITAGSLSMRLLLPQWERRVAITILVVAGLTVWGLDRAQRSVKAGYLEEALTWEAYRERSGERAGTPEKRALMRQVAIRVQDFRAAHNLAGVTLGITGGIVGGYSEASTSRHGRRAHMSLGHRWFGHDSVHLATTVEHELAHVRRYDSLRSNLQRAASTGAAGLAIAMLPPVTAIIGLVILAALYVLAIWWQELACDRAAVLICGRAAERAFWRAELQRERTLPPVHSTAGLALCAEHWATHRCACAAGGPATVHAADAP